MDSSLASEPLPLTSIKQDLIVAYMECSARGLVHTAQWCVCICAVCVCVCLLSTWSRVQ